MSRLTRRPPDLPSDAAPRGRTIRNSVNSPGCVSTSIDAGMLLDDDVVAERQAEAGPFAGRLGREERIEHLLLHLGRDAGAVVADPDLDAVAEVLASRRRASARRPPFASALRFVAA